MKTLKLAYSLLNCWEFIIQGERSGTGRTLMSKQSSTESGPSSSQRLSRQSSSETMLPVSGKRQTKSNAPEWQKESVSSGGLSWHGTPRADPRRMATPQASHSTSLPRHFHAPNQRRNIPDPGNTRIPLIEYHLLDRDSDSGSDVKIINGARKSPYIKRHSGEHDEDAHRKLGPDNKSYIKYNSFANYWHVHISKIHLRKDLMLQYAINNFVSWHFISLY